MDKYDAVVIGAGNGGLTAAATLARKGLKVMLLERHNIPGGAATSFCRGRFEFEVALHQLSGLGTPEKPGLLRMDLDKLGVLEDLEFVDSGTGCASSHENVRSSLSPDPGPVNFRPPPPARGPFRRKGARTW